MLREKYVMELFFDPIWNVERIFLFGNLISVDVFFLLFHSKINKCWPQKCCRCHTTTTNQRQKIAFVKWQISNISIRIQHIFSCSRMDTKICQTQSHLNFKPGTHIKSIVGNLCMDWQSFVLSATVPVWNHWLDSVRLFLCHFLFLKIEICYIDVHLIYLTEIIDVFYRFGRNRNKGNIFFSLFISLFFAVFIVFVKVGNGFFFLMYKLKHPMLSCWWPRLIPTQFIFWTKYSLLFACPLAIFDMLKVGCSCSLYLSRSFFPPSLSLTRIRIWDEKSKSLFWLC